jgi:hypothetical protein
MARRLSCRGPRPLQLAATNGHVDVMLLLLSHYADVDDSLSNATAPDALQLASYHGRCDAVALLLAVGARFTPIDGGRSVFSIAFGNIHRGALHSTALATLVANGALAADTVTSGDSIDYNCADCATLIVAAGYEPTALDFKSHPESVVATCRRIALDPVRINAAQRRIVRVQIDLIRHRATEICIALRALDISALELCEIISTALPLSRFVKLHHIWGDCDHCEK